DRQQLAEENEEERAQRRSEEIVHADRHHGEQFAGEPDRGRIVGDEVVLEGGERPAEAGDGGGKDEGYELVALDRVALEGGAQLVLADGDQHMAERRARHALERIDDRKSHQRDEGVIGGGMVEIDGAEMAALEPAEAVLAAGYRGPAEGDGGGQ